MNETHDEYKILDLEELKSILKEAAQDPEYSDDIWNRFEYRKYMDEGNFSQAKIQLMDLLLKCKNIDPISYEKCHKGTPFYWLGLINFYLQDYQTATFFFDAAVSQDLRQGRNPDVYLTPAISYLTLYGEYEYQAAKDLVLAIQGLVTETINFYNQKSGEYSGKNINNIEELRIKFLFPSINNNNPRLRTLVTAFISFFGEWHNNNKFLEIRAGTGTSEPFFTHLFIGCVLFESLLKNHSSETKGCNTMDKLLKRYYKELFLDEPPKVNSSTMTGVIDKLPEIEINIKNSITITAQVRNALGHNFGWNVDFKQKDYGKLVQMIAISCLHTINCLYK